MLDLTAIGAAMNTKEMAGQFHVSERTARRHIARGTVPDVRRTVGADGKTYPGSHGFYRHGRRPSRQWTPLITDLGTARTAVRRLARATKFTDEDLAELRTIAGEAGDLVRRWTISVEANERERSRRKLFGT
jgi:hypothetical protein